MKKKEKKKRCSVTISPSVAVGRWVSVAGSIDSH